MSLELMFDGWRERWREMEVIARRRGWTVTPVAWAPPATEAELVALETRHGVRIPAQLRDVLSRLAASVAFGWHIPAEARPRGPLGSLVAGGLRDTIWSLAHIDRYAIANFAGWRARLANTTDAERPNVPAQWAHQFPFAELVNGDMLTIDCARPDAQPVRYFSHQLDGLHGAAIAPDFYTFVTVYARLGCAGGEHSDWFRFCTDREELDAATEGAIAWRRWLESDVAADPDEPPRPILAISAADRALLAAAQAGDLVQVVAALDAGAQPDCVANAHRTECVTALSFALQRDDRPMMELLLDRGASINTTRHLLTEAVRYCRPPALIRWLVGRGARVNGWRHDRETPLHRAFLTHPKYAYEAAHRREVIMMLLESGADPDARWDRQTTMLMWCGLEGAKALLAHGADLTLRDEDGQLAIHYYSGHPEKLRFLVERGLDVNAGSTSPHAPAAAGRTPLHNRLISWHPATEAVAMLLELGADPVREDASGLSAVFFCQRVADLELLLAHAPQLDLHARTRDGGTILHHQVTWAGGRITHHRPYIEHLIARGLDVNAVDDAGQTVLHLVAVKGEPEDVVMLLELGADRTRTDKAGRRARDCVAKNRRDLRALLS